MRITWKAELVLMAAIFACMFSVGGCRNTNDAGGAPPFMNGTVEVAVVTLKAQQVPMTTELPARVRASLVAEIRPQVNGIIQKRLFIEGANVKEGDILYQIDPSPYQTALNSAKASLARTEANLGPMRLKAERYKELVAINAVSQQDYDDAQAALKQIEAEVETGKAAVETARINLNNTNIRAPITGRIGRSSVTVGALATAYQASAFATIQQLDPIFVDATQSSASLLRLKREAAAGRVKSATNDQVPVRLLLEDGTPYPAQGRLQFSDVTVDSETGSFVVRMTFPNPKRLLLPGMYVRAILQEGIAERSILVPQQAVSRDTKGNPYVLVVDDENKVHQQAITVDRAIEDEWLVSSGLQPGNRVIMEGSQKVRPGVSVKAVPFNGDFKDKKTADGDTARTKAKGGR